MKLLSPPLYQQISSIISEDSERFRRLVLCYARSNWAHPYFYLNSSTGIVSSKFTNKKVFLICPGQPVSEHEIKDAQKVLALDGDHVSIFVALPHDDPISSSELDYCQRLLGTYCPSKLETVSLRTLLEKSLANPRYFSSLFPQQYAQSQTESDKETLVKIRQLIPERPDDPLLLTKEQQHALLVKLENLHSQIGKNDFKLNNELDEKKRISLLFATRNLVIALKAFANNRTSNLSDVGYESLRKTVSVSAQDIFPLSSI